MTDNPTTSDLLHSSPGYQLWKVGEAARRAFEDAVADLGIRSRHVRVMTFLHGKPQSQSELCRLSGLDRTTMVAVVDDLEEHGYARRGADPADRRTKQISLTPQGKKALTKAIGQLQAAQEAFLSPLSSAEQSTLIALTTRLYDAHGPGCETGD